MDNEGVCLYCGKNSYYPFCSNKCEMDYARYWSLRDRVRKPLIYATIATAIIMIIVMSVLSTKWNMIIAGAVIIMVSYLVNTTLLVDDKEIKKIPIMEMRKKTYKASIITALLGIALIISDIILLMTIW